MTLYSLNGARPAPLPFRIVLPGGRTRTDPTSFKPEEIAAAGLVEAPAPPSYDPATQRPPEWTGSSWTVTAIPLADLKLAKWEAVKTLRDTTINGGVNVPGIGPFQTDEISRGYINGAVTMAQIAIANSQPFAMDWTLADNSIAALDGSTMIAVGVAAGRHVADCHERAQALRAAIEGVASTAALAAIDITTGWPENA